MDRKSATFFFEELIKRMSNAYLKDKKRTKNGQLKDFAV